MSDKSDPETPDKPLSWPPGAAQESQGETGSPEDPAANGSLDSGTGGSQAEGLPDAATELAREAEGGSPSPSPNGAVEDLGSAEDAASSEPEAGDGTPTDPEADAIEAAPVSLTRRQRRKIERLRKKEERLAEKERARRERELEAQAASEDEAPESAEAGDSDPQATSEAEAVSDAESADTAEGVSDAKSDATAADDDTAGDTAVEDGESPEVAAAAAAATSAPRKKGLISRLFGRGGDDAEEQPSAEADETEHAVPANEAEAESTVEDSQADEPAHGEVEARIANARRAAENADEDGEAPTEAKQDDPQTAAEAAERLAAAEKREEEALMQLGESSVHAETERQLREVEERQLAAEKRLAEAQRRSEQRAERAAKGSPVGFDPSREQLIKELEQSGRDLEGLRESEAELGEEIDLAEETLKEEQARTERALAEANARLEDIESRAKQAEIRANRAQRLAELKNEEVERERRLREMLGRIGEAERRAREAEERARQAVRRLAAPTVTPSAEAGESKSKPAEPDLPDERAGAASPEPEAAIEESSSEGTEPPSKLSQAAAQASPQAEPSESSGGIQWKKIGPRHASFTTGGGGGHAAPAQPKPQDAAGSAEAADSTDSAEVAPPSWVPADPPRDPAPSTGDTEADPDAVQASGSTPLAAAPTAAPDAAQAAPGAESAPHPAGTPPSEKAGSDSQGRSTPDDQGRISINDATFEDLRRLNFSVTQTGRVLAHRERHGGFKSLDDLEQVPGFPMAFLEEVKSKLKV